MEKPKHVLVFFLFLCLFLFSQSSLLPQTQWKWEQIYPAVNPSPGRLMFNMAYDSFRGRIVLFGGSYDNDQGVNDTWEFDGSTWILRNPPVKPSIRWAYNVAYDSHRKVVVLFGGETWPNTHNDTWEYDGTTWTRIYTAHAPQDRAHFAMAYDSIRKKTVLFGGWHWYTDLGDTWEYDGNDWVQKYPATPPGVRQHPAMAYDAGRGVVVLFGGTRQYKPQGGPFNDTWEWNGTNWNNTIPHNPTADPSPRANINMVYDAKRGKIVMHGGGGILDDTWEYNGTEWTQLETVTTPGLHRWESMVYDSGRDVIILSRGTYRTPENETWELHLVNQKPVALCQDVETSVDLDCHGFITAEDVDNGSYDPDDDEITLSLDNSGPFSPGVYNVTLTVTDSHNESDSCQATITVSDTTPPVPDNANLPDIVGQCSAQITTIPIASDNCAEQILGSTTDPLEYTQQGEYNVTWTYDDGNGNTTRQNQKVIVNDSLPPVVADISASPDVLWPPNHKMVPVVVTISFSDNCDSSPSAEIIAVISNEPVNVTGDGNTAPDWEITGDLTVNLRAERAGNGNSRVYTITVKCEDGNGNFTLENVTVTVPHNKKKK